MMNGKVMKWLVIAAALMLVGVVVVIGVMIQLGWDFTKVSTVRYETNEYTLTDNYRNISILTTTADVTFVPADTVTTEVICHEPHYAMHTVMTKSDTLSIEVLDKRPWYERIGIFSGEPSVTIYMPQGEYGKLLIGSDTGDVTIPKEFVFESVDVAVDTGDVTNAASTSLGIIVRTHTGHIDIHNVSTDSLTIENSTGKVTVTDMDCAGDIMLDMATGKTQLTNVTCHNLLSDGDTGALLMQNVVAEGRFVIERDTGSVRFDGCDAAEIRVETDTGSVKGSLLSDKVFVAHSDTGSVTVPKTVEGGRCEIETDTGNIEITIDRPALV